jgi:hypothetical protein
MLFHPVSKDIYFKATAVYMYPQMAFFLQVFELKAVCIAVLDNACDVTRSTILIDVIVRGIVSMKLCITEFDLKSNI